MSEYVWHLKNLCVENLAEQSEAVTSELPTPELTPKLSSTPLSTLNVLSPTSQQLLLQVIKPVSTLLIPQSLLDVTEPNNILLLSQT